MKDSTYCILQKLGYKGSPDDQANSVISWLSPNDFIRIEPHWRFLGSNGGFSWGKSWDEFSEPKEVQCETWYELLEIALEVSLEEAFGNK